MKEAVLYNSLFLETFWMIDHARGDVLWSCGQHGTFGRKEPPDEPLFEAADELPNGNVLIANTTEGRIIEVAPGGEIVWDMRVHFYRLDWPHEIYQLQRISY